MEDQLFAAYMAGVIDSDGSISICCVHKSRPTPSYIVSIQLSWSFNEKTLKVMEKIKSIYGGNISLTNRKLSNSFKTRVNQTYKYNVTSQQSRKLLEDIQPYLLLKSEQCQNALDLISSNKVGQYSRYNPKPKEVTAYDHSLFLKNKMINTKNGKEDYVDNKK